jgi:hypothetical protein
MSHFYLTLPSDSSSRYYPENTTACFKTKLSERIELDGEFEVGLAQLIYPHSWFNFVNIDREFTAYFLDDDGTRHDHVFSSGQYRDENKLVEHFNEKVKLQSIVFSWNQWKRRMKLSVLKDGGEFFMSEALKAFLGFDRAGPYREGTFYSTPGFDLKSRSRLMYVYCDIASYTCVGDEKVPLLRVCDTEGEYGQMIRTIFTHPHYIPISRTSFETLEININTELGRPMPFEFGKAVVTLHFRRKNKLLL